MINTVRVYYIHAVYYIEQLAMAWDRKHPKALPDCTQDILCERSRWHKKDCYGGTIATERYVKGIINS